MRLIVRLSAATSVTSVVGLLFISLRASVPNVPPNTWSPTGDMSQARAGASGALMYDGKVLVTGGRDGSGAVSRIAERYSPDSRLFLPTPPMTFARANHTSTLLPDGCVLVAGGTPTATRPMPLKSTIPARTPGRRVHRCSTPARGTPPRRSTTAES